MNVPLRKDILATIQRAKMGDIGVSMAYVDILAALYFGEENGKSILQVEPEKPQWEGRDHVVVSDLAAWPALKVCLKQAKFQIDPGLDMPTIKTPGVEVVPHSSGQGLAIAWGMAQSLQISKKSNQVYVVLGDDDLRCGMTWEAAMGIAFDRLDHVTAICAHYGSAKWHPLQDKFEAFGWKVIQVVDGHDEEELVDAIARAREVERQPTVVLAPTVFGKGIPFAEGKQQYRGSLFSPAEMEEAVRHFNLQT